ncbi:MAG: hypothetical protein ACM3ZT_10900 [Bacillota bacterium]
MMKNTNFALIPGLAALGLLAGCSSGPVCGNPHPYAQALTGPVLKAPPGLTLPAPDPAYVIPRASTTAAPVAATRSGACMITPPDVLSPPGLTKASPAGAAPAAGTHAPPVAARGPME